MGRLQKSKILYVDDAYGALRHKLTKNWIAWLNASMHHKKYTLIEVWWVFCFFHLLLSSSRPLFLNCFCFKNVWMYWMLLRKRFIIRKVKILYCHFHFVKIFVWLIIYKCHFLYKDRYFYVFSNLDLSYINGI